MRLAYDASQLGGFCISEGSLYIYYPTVQLQCVINSISEDLDVSMLYWRCQCEGPVRYIMDLVAVCYCFGGFVHVSVPNITSLLAQIIFSKKNTLVSGVLWII